MVKDRVKLILTRSGRRVSEAGFTLVEMLVVLAIIALLAALTGPQVLGYVGKAKVETAKSQIAAISTALELYALDTGTFPTEEEGLAALVQPPKNGVPWHGPYLKRAEGLIDPWGRPYHYKFPGHQGAPDVFTLGRDNAPGGDTQISNN